MSFHVDWIGKVPVSPACCLYDLFLILSACFLEKMEGFYGPLIL